MTKHGVWDIRGGLVRARKKACVLIVDSIQEITEHNRQRNGRVHVIPHMVNNQSTKPVALGASVLHLVISEVFQKLGERPDLASMLFVQVAQKIDVPNRVRRNPLVESLVRDV